jgi:hypothetical protein
MELPSRKPTSATDDGSESGVEISARRGGGVVAADAGFPAAATSAVASFFDLEDEAAFAEAENDLLTNAGKTADNTAETTPKNAASAESASEGPGAVASASSELPFYSIGRERVLAPVGHATRDTDTTLAEAEAVAGVCREFDRLMADGHHSLRTAAAELGRSPSFFSGENSPYARFQRHGFAGLLPKQREVTSSMTVPAWFVPAARFFYLLTNRTQYSGSMPEAVRRVISLPNLPFGWTNRHRERFLKAIGLVALPSCPAELREEILARQAAAKPLVPPSIARQIIVNKSIVKFSRSPRDWMLDNQSAPGSQRRYLDKQTGERKIQQPGDWFGGDDATPGIAVCVPCNEVITPVSQKFGVLLGRWQWLPFHDARTDKILAHSYVIRPRGSYRAEDILNGMGAVVRTHGIPNKGFQFEGGAWNSKLVKQAIALLGCEHWRTYSPHQKAIEAVFNKVWTRLAVQFPHADMGRYRNENEANCKLYEACKAGHQDPRKYFPTLEIVVRVFEEEVSAHNTKLIVSSQYGRWIPDEYFSQAVKAAPLRGFSAEMEWMFSPYAAERKVKGMMVSCRVPMFENFSVPFDFGADWLPEFAGKKVRLHFNPRQPKCAAKVVLLENSGPRKAGDILGDAQLIGETAGHIRYILNWGDDDQRAGYLQRQRVGNFVRRETRGIGLGGRVEYSQSEERDGLAKVSQLEKSNPQTAGVIHTGNGDPEATRPGSRVTTACANLNSRSARLESPSAEAGAGAVDDRAARRAELEELERQTNHLFA